MALRAAFKTFVLSYMFMVLSNHKRLHGFRVSVVFSVRDTCD